MIYGREGPELRVVESERRGRSCRLPAVNQRVPTRTLLEHSFAVKGAKVFNSLPKEIRGYDGSLNGFKARIDTYLVSIPDRPYLPHYYLNVLSNSLTDIQ